MNKFSNIDEIHNISEDELRDIFNDIDTEISLQNKPKIINPNINDSTQTNIIRSDIDDKCPNCNTKDGIKEDYTQGFMVCTNCGQVLDNVFDNNPEWRQYGDETTDTSRCSAPINKLLPQSSLGTTIGGGTWKTRLKTIHSWSAMPYRERSLCVVFKDIQFRCSKAKLMKCIEDDAKIMYKTVSECKHIKGKNKGKYIIVRGANRKSLIAACVFFACKRKNMTRSPKEIADLFDIKYTDMTRGCKCFLKMIKIKKMFMNVGASHPEHFTERFCVELKIKKQYQDQCVQIAINIRKLNIASEHTPLSIAAGSILLMAQLNNLPTLSKRKISEKLGISEVTITKASRKLEPYRDILSNNKLIDKLVTEINTKMADNPVPEDIRIRCEKYNIQLDKPKILPIPSINVIADEDISDELELSIGSSNIDPYEDFAMFLTLEHEDLVNRLFEINNEHDDIVSKYIAL